MSVTLREEAEDQFLEELFLSMYKQLLKYAYSRIGNYHRAEELAMDAFLLAREKLPDVMESRNPEGWLMKTLKNLIMHEFRTRKLIHKLFADMPEFTEPAAREDDGGFELLDALTPEDRGLLYAAYVEGRPMGEIAKDLGIGYSACVKRMQKARARAREALGGP
ncbi:MAG: sigma-70 family RNA polymerase sigma factor [Oscillospiraceae bacterium]|nr:sigma-70 family RNA polymerase sigma factor [Oscillospiraceae bacterium]